MAVPGTACIDGPLEKARRRLIAYAGDAAVMGGETMIGYKGGGGEAFSEYGHRPCRADTKMRSVNDGRVKRSIGFKLNGQ